MWHSFMRFNRHDIDEIEKVSEGEFAWRLLPGISALVYFDSCIWLRLRVWLC